LRSWEFVLAAVPFAVGENRENLRKSSAITEGMFCHCRFLVFDVEVDLKT